jgi:hypothetical protein
MLIHWIAIVFPIVCVVAFAAILATHWPDRKRQTDAPDDDVRTRLSLALAGAERLLGAAWESIDNSTSSPNKL